MNILDGKNISSSIRLQLAEEVKRFSEKYGRVPNLEVILVGEDPASLVYTRNKNKAAVEIGMSGKLHKLPLSTSQSELLSLLDKLNNDDSVDGILVQLPLPDHISKSAVLNAVNHQKDVDGFHPINMGLMMIGSPTLAPCTPLACMKLIEASGVTIAGSHAVIVGSSNIVGKPVGQLLLQNNATVTMCHKYTKDLPDICRQADILVVAVGKPNLIRGNYINPGVIIIDVGINRVVSEKGESVLVGDVVFEEAKEKAGAITPVPGGVGPLTITYLLENTIKAAYARYA